MKIPKHVDRTWVTPREHTPPTRGEIVAYVVLITAAFGFALLVMLAWGTS